MYTQPQAQTPIEYTPTMLPSQERNKKAVHCRTCGIRITAGSAYRWDWTKEAGTLLRNASPNFYCLGCHRHHLVLNQAQADAYPVMRQIETWCKDVPLSMHYITYSQIERMVHSAGVRQAELAWMILEGLQALDECSYSAAIDVARSALKQLASRPADFDDFGGVA